MSTATDIKILKPAQPDIGSVLQSLRKSKGLTLNALALAAGVSAGMVSQIERGRANPSVKILEKLRNALDVPLSTLLEGKPDVKQAVSRSSIAAEPEENFIRRVANRPKFNVGRTPFSKELLSPSGAEDMQFMVIHIPAYGGPEEVVMRPGQKAGLVVSGVLTLLIDDQQFVLYPGDSFQFEGNRPHGLKNDTGSDTTLLWILASVKTIHL